METDQQDIEAALREREEQYEFLAENIPVQIWTARPDGHLDYVTEQTARSFGLAPADILRDGWQNVVHAEDLGRAVERWTHALATGDVYEVEFRLRLASGEYAFHLARAIPQRAPDGTILRWLGTNTNIQAQIDERRRVEALLHEVAEQSRESANAILALRARVAELEAKSGAT